jgi:hypothetical protein
LCFYFAYFLFCLYYTIDGNKKAVPIEWVYHGPAEVRVLTKPQPWPQATSRLFMLYYAYMY